MYCMNSNQFPPVERNALRVSIILVSLTMSGCATNSVTETSAGTQSGIVTEEIPENKKKSNKHRIRLLKRAAKVSSHTIKSDQKKRDELLNGRPETKDKGGHSHPQTTPKKEGFWARFTRVCQHPACKFSLLIDFTSWIYKELTGPPP